jgi:hypothetical protein
MTLPAREEINVYDTLDERVACDHFLGKSLEQAEALFRENSLHYQEDLMWMGPIAFRFYVQSFVSYIQSDSAAADSDVSGFASILEHRLEFEPAELIAIAPYLAAACRNILNQFDRYSCQPESYGDLRLRLESLDQRLSELA